MENKEMNLFDFILFCCKGLMTSLKKFGVFALATVRFGLRYSWIIVPFVCLGLFGGWLWTKPFATKYKGNATIMYVEGMRDVVNEGLMEFFSSSWKTKKQYGLSDDVLEAFDRAMFYNVIDCNTDSVADYVDRDRRISLADTVNGVMRDRVCVEIEMNGEQDFDQFEAALKQYFASQEYLTRADEYCRKIRDERLEYLEREVARLDSFSTYDYFVRNDVANFEIITSRYCMSTGKELHYNDVLSVLKHKQYLENQKYFTPEVINFQTPFIVHSLSHLRKYFYGGLAGILLGFGLALMIRYWAEIVAYMKEK
jgi:hypothetical protein